MTKSSVLVLLGGFALYSCAAMQQSWNEHNCDPDTAYATGHNEARAGQEMQVTKYDACPGDNKSQIKTSYRQGFEAGLKSMQSTQPTIVINSIAATPTPAVWHCSLDIINDHYDGYGPTEEAAKVQALTECRKRKVDFWCDSPVKCGPQS